MKIITHTPKKEAKNPGTHDNVHRFFAFAQNDTRVSMSLIKIT